MGLTQSCTVTVGTRHFKAQVELETDEIVVRGPEGFRLKFEDIRESISVDKGILRAADSKRSATFDLGAKEAAVWREKVIHPPTRVDKLGIKERTRVALIGEIPEDLREEILRVRATVVQGGTVALIVLGVETLRDLRQLDTLREWIFPSGGIWVVRRKASQKVSERDLRAAAKAAKLVAVKVARISETLTADKLIVPSKER